MILIVERWLVFGVKLVRMLAANAEAMLKRSDKRECHSM